MATPASTEPISVCEGCQAQLHGAYCHQCGERAGAPDLSLKHYAHEAFHELFHVDGKLVRTLRKLLFAPGELTEEFLAGRRKRQVHPFRVYLVIFALHIVLYTAYQPASVYSIDTMIKQQPQGDESPLGKLVRDRAEKKGMTYEQAKVEIDRRWQKNVSYFQIIDVVLLAMVLALIYYAQKRFFVEHLVFATHYESFQFLFGCLIWPIYLIFGVGTEVSFPLAVAMIVASMAYLYLALKRIYKQPPGATVMKAIIVALGSLLINVTLFMASLIPAMVAVLKRQ